MEESMIFSLEKTLDKPGAVLIETVLSGDSLYYQNLRQIKKNNLPTEGGCGKAIFLKISKNRVRHGISYARITQLATCNSDVRQNDTGQAQLLPKFIIYYDSKKFTCDVQDLTKNAYMTECRSVFNSVEMSTQYVRKFTYNCQTGQ